MLDEIYSRAARIRSDRRRRIGLGVALACLVAIPAVRLIPGDGGDDVSTIDEPTSSSASTTLRTDTTTTRPTTTSSSVSTTTAAVPDALQLEGDGLGATPFGTSSEEAMQTMVRSLGEPDSDTGEVPFEEGCAATVDHCRSLAPECRTAEVARFVNWTGFGVTFYGAAGQPRFASWNSSVTGGDAGVVIPTAAGLDVTDPLAVWREVYGSRFSTAFFQGGEAEGDPWVETIELRLPDGLIAGFTEIAAGPAYIDTLFAGVNCSGGDY